MRRLILASAAFLALGGLLFAMPQPTRAQQFKDFNDQITECENASEGDPIYQSAFCKEYRNEVNTLYGPNGILTRVISFLSIIVGIAGVVTMIIAGIRFINSGGDPQKVSTAKNTILYGAAGIALAALAQVIVVFIVRQIE